MIDRTVIIKKSKEVISQEIDGETILLDMHGELYFSLNEVGTCIWQHLQEPCTLKKIFAKMIDEYNVEAEQLQNDLDDLLDQLLSAGLVTVQESDSDDKKT